MCLCVVCAWMQGSSWSWDIGSCEPPWMSTGTWSSARVVCAHNCWVITGLRYVFHCIIQCLLENHCIVIFLDEWLWQGLLFTCKCIHKHTYMYAIDMDTYRPVHTNFWRSVSIPDQFSLLPFVLWVEVKLKLLRWFGELDVYTRLRNTVVIKDLQLVITNMKIRSLFILCSIYLWQA